MSYNNRGGYRPRYEGGGNRYRNSGGGGGPNRYRDNRRNYNNGGGYAHHQRRPYDRPPPPPSREEDDLEDIEIRLKGLIIKIGDKIKTDLQVNLKKMRNILDKDYSKYPETVTNTLTACVTELPTKAPVYGTLIGLLNITSHDIVSKLMIEFNKTFEQALQSFQWFKVKQLLRFYGELVNANVILPTTYCNLLNDLLSVLDQPNQQPRQRLDCIVYIILATLPWAGKELSERCATELDEQVLKKIEIYMQRRGSIPKLQILKAYHDDKFNSENDDMLTHIWTLIQDLKNNAWELPLIPKLYRWFDKDLTSALQHDLPRFMVPPHTDKTTYIHPMFTMKILVNDEDGQSFDIIPEHQSMDYFILQEIIFDVLHLYEVNRKDCAKYLLSIPNSFNSKLFKAPSLTEKQQQEEDSVIKTEEMDTSATEEEEGKWSISDLLVENIFSHMFQLPTPTIRQIFYSCVFIELCRAESATFPMALGRGIKTLFNRLNVMDAECIARFWNWFSHHLSNFGFQWDWKFWEPTVLPLVQQQPNHPQVCFLRETLEKVIRLSYYERIKAILPEELYPLISPQAPAPEFAFKDPNDPLHATAKTIIESLRAKKTVDELQQLLEEYANRMKEEVMSDRDDQQQQLQLDHLKRIMFIQCLLWVGSKSFSHILNVVERYLEMLRSLNSTPDARVHTVQIVASFWKNNTQFLGILLDKLLNYRVIDPTSVITWIFEKEQLQFTGRAFLWEILKNTLSKVNSRVVQVKAKLENFQSLHETNKAQRAAQDEQTEAAQAEDQQELNSLRLVENSLANVTRDQKEVFMLVYQKFTQVLQELINNATSNGEEPESNFEYRWVFGWYKEILRVYHKECGGFMVTLETLVFTPELDKRINEVFNEVKTFKQEIDLLV
ncbi:armadillo-type protein [Mycotypha africana]|uniref:armadillo-type protein n=1 Tax=Mycotypha africana TaxID=64632 RepID=UPI0023000568|nr:armadillo-type protein [Mycotypha africana]KAI8992033.1 armadillo-type protein [Mycotypha africana]